MIPVTNENLNLFVEKYVDYVLTIRVKRQFDAFADGFMALIAGNRAFKLFQYDELDIHISGIDIVNWDRIKQTAIYGNGYTSNSNPVIWFWEVFDGLPDTQKKKFMRFVAGSERLPIGWMCLRIEKTGDPTKLPVAHTCFFMLALPDYPDKQMLENKLLLAIEHSDGFWLK
jgi:hypothetical protein